MARYAELRAHTAFSFGDGSVTPDKLVTHAKKLGYEAIGITDTADLGALPRAAAAAKHEGIRLIAGAELRVDGFPAAFLARNERGYRNLATLVTASRVGTWRTWEKDVNAKNRGHPNVSWSQVAEHSDGLQMLTGPMSGQIPQLLGSGCRGQGARLLGEWREVFGNRLAVEVQMHHVGGNEAALTAGLITLAKWCAVPWVVTNDPRYIDNQSRLVHDLLTALRYGYDIETAERAGVLHPNGEWRLYSPEQMRKRWEHTEQGIDESARIASECSFDLAWMRPPLPTYSVPDGRSDDEFLREKVLLGAQQRWGDVVGDKECKQIEKELELISRLGFSGFFLVMWDAVALCATAENSLPGARKRRELRRGVLPGNNCRRSRQGTDCCSNGFFPKFGSTGGSEAAPDIDVDFEHDRREEVLDYLYKKYERPNAAIACTVQMYRAPNAVLDAMRAFGYPAELATSISKRLHRYDPAAAALHMQEKLRT